MLTTNERADIKRLVDSSETLRQSEAYLNECIKGWSTPEARVALGNALTHFQSAQVEHWRALAFFLHLGTENTEPLPNRTASEWYDLAWFHLDRYRLDLGDISAALTAAQAHHVDQPVYQDNLNRARDIWLSYAITHANAMDLTLTYEAPWPDLLPGKTIPTVVGPHGHYRLMQWYVNRGKNYAMDTYAALLTAYQQGADGQRIRDAWAQSAGALDTLDHCTALLADVTFTAEEAAEDRFCRALRVGKLMTVNAAERYQAWGDVVAGFLPAPYDLVVAKLVDSWKQGIDLATWQSLFFPESTRCPAPFLGS